jgi:hypothetical protein
LPWGAFTVTKLPVPDPSRCENFARSANIARCASSGEKREAHLRPLGKNDCGPDWLPTTGIHFVRRNVSGIAKAVLSIRFVSGTTQSAPPNVRQRKHR